MNKYSYQILGSAPYFNSISVHSLDFSKGSIPTARCSTAIFLQGISRFTSIGESNRKRRTLLKPKSFVRTFKLFVMNETKLYKIKILLTKGPHFVSNHTVWIDSCMRKTLFCCNYRNTKQFRKILVRRNNISHRIDAC